MELKFLKRKAAELNDFYMFYKRTNPTVGGQTYLVGTVDFDNKFILQRMLSVENPCGLPFVELRNLGKNPSDSKKLGLLEKLSKQAESNNSILVYSWSSDRFRVMNAHIVAKMTGLASVLNNDVHSG